MSISDSSSLWYLHRAQKCQHERISADGKRRTRCERFSKAGTSYCPSHQGAQREYTTQETCIAIASFFCLVRV